MKKDENKTHLSFVEKITHLSHKSLLQKLFLLKVLNIFLVQTWFVPDEYWQSLEVAHRMVFGYGHLTWEWKVGLRSYIYTLLFAFPYKVLQVLGLDSVFLLKFVPRLIQGGLSALSELLFYLTVKNLFGATTAAYSLFCFVTSWFWWYCQTRTLINTFETNIVCIALYFYSKHALPSKKVTIRKTGNKFLSKHFNFVVIAAVVGFYVRPTSASVWLPLFSIYLLQIYKNYSFSLCFKVTLNILTKALVVFAFLALVDRICYGEWVSVHLNFLFFNLIDNKGTFYGEHPWHWYFTQGLPVVFSIHLLFCIYGFWLYESNVENQAKSNTVQQHFLLIFKSSITTTLLLYSIPGHKEFRFILVLMPFVSFYSGHAISTLNKKYSKLCLLLVSNVLAALYFGLEHQRAPSMLLDQLYKLKPEPNEQTLFLMPCHSTPFYSHLHLPTRLKFITCEPDLENTPGYKDESVLFYEDPNKWLESEYRSSFDNCSEVGLPNYIVLYDVLYDKLYETFSTCYYDCYKTLHTLFPEGRVGRNALILCKKKFH